MIELEQPPCGGVDGLDPCIGANRDHAGRNPLEDGFDIAAAFVELNRPFVDTHNLLAHIPDAAPDDRPAALGGTAPFLYGTARRVVFGGVPFDKPRIGLSRATSGSSSRSERDGILGNDLLSFFDVTLDYGRRTLVLEQRRSQ